VTSRARIDWIVLGVLVITWGSAFAGLKIAVGGIHPFWVSAIRLWVATVPLWIIGRMRCEPLPPLSPTKGSPWPAYAMLGLVGFAIAWFLARGAGRVEAPALTLENPVDIVSALRFAALLALIMLLVPVLRDWLGDAGLYLLALVSGFVDVDAISLSTAKTSAAGRSKVSVQLSTPLLPSVSRAVIRSVSPDRRTLPVRMKATPSCFAISATVNWPSRKVLAEGCATTLSPGNRSRAAAS